MQPIDPTEAVLYMLLAFALACCAVAIAEGIREYRLARRRARHDAAVARILWPHVPARPRTPNARELAILRVPPKSSDLLPWR